MKWTIAKKTVGGFTAMLLLLLRVISYPDPFRSRPMRRGEVVDVQNEPSSDEEPPDREA